MKDVPYFPLYAANIMSNRYYRLMSLSERGLWITILLECWVNEGVPSDHKKAEKIMGLKDGDMKNFFSDYSKLSFHIEDSQYVSTELNAYRKDFMDRREKQRLGGIKGAKRKKLPKGNPVGLPQGKPEGSLNYINSNQVISNQITNKVLQDQSTKEWIDDYDSSSDANDYRRHSKG